MGAGSVRGRLKKRGPATEREAAAGPKAGTHSGEDLENLYAGLSSRKPSMHAGLEPWTEARACTPGAWILRNYALPAPPPGGSGAAVPAGARAGRPVRRETTRRRPSRVLLWEPLAPHGWRQPTSFEFVPWYPSLCRPPNIHELEPELTLVDLERVSGAARNPGDRQRLSSRKTYAEGLDAFVLVA